MELCANAAVTDHRREESKVHDGLGTLQSFSSSATKYSCEHTIEHVHRSSSVGGLYMFSRFNADSRTCPKT